MNGMISETKVNGPEVEAVLDAIQPALEQFPRNTVLVSLLSLVVLMQDPYITHEQLQNCIKGASQYICMFLSSDGMPKEQMN